MSESKPREHDTTPETPSSKRTIAVRTHNSDPPPSPYPKIRPAAGTPAAEDPSAGAPSTRSAQTLPRGVKAVRAPASKPNGFLLGAAFFAVVMTVVAFLASHAPTP